MPAQWLFIISDNLIVLFTYLLTYLLATPALIIHPEMGLGVRLRAVAGARRINCSAVDAVSGDAVAAREPINFRYGVRPFLYRPASPVSSLNAVNRRHPGPVVRCAAGSGFGAPLPPRRNLVLHCIREKAADILHSFP